MKKVYTQPRALLEELSNEQVLTNSPEYGDNEYADPFAELT